MTEPLRHKFDGLNGIRCKQPFKRGVTIGLSWDTITCPECLAKKEAHEPASVEIDTRGD